MPFVLEPKYWTNENLNLVMALHETLKITQVFTIHPEGGVNVCITFMAIHPIVVE